MTVKAVVVIKTHFTYFKPRSFVSENVYSIRFLVWEYSKIQASSLRGHGPVGSIWETEGPCRPPCFSSIAQRGGVRGGRRGLLYLQGAGGCEKERGVPLLVLP